MKTLIVALLLTSFVAVPAFGQDAMDEKKEEPKAAKKEVAKEEGKWHGYVVDAMCAKNMLKKGNAMEKAAKHTRDCALEEACAESGYGLFHDSKYYKFDEAGDKMAKEAIEKSTAEKNLMFDVTGKMEGDRIMVASLSEMKMDNMEMGKKSGEMKKDMKKMEKKEGHKQ